MADQYNPVRAVDGTEVPCPSAYKVLYSDVSQSDSGRTEDGKMWKLKVGQLVKLEMSWQNLTSDKVQVLLKAFDPEYFQVTYFDIKRNAYRTSEFYVGDRTAEMYNAKRGLWSSISFNIIERGVS